MADITCCEGVGCPLKKDCYRFTAHKNPYRQSFFAIIPYDKEKEECKHFWNVNKPIDK